MINKAIKTALLVGATLIATQISAQNRDTTKPTTPSEYSSQTKVLQSKAEFGILETKKFDEYLRTIEGVGNSARELLTEQSLKSYMMPPRKIGTSGRSSDYALASTLEFYVNLNSNYKDNLSPDYIRLNTTKPSIEESLVWLAGTGTVSAAIMNYETNTIPTSVYSAQKFKIKNYLKLFNSSAIGQQKIYEIKKSIMRGYPVIVELQVNTAFKTLKETRFWRPLEGDQKPLDPQYLVVVGYDEERKALELLNCQGREWGNGGYIWISYDDFATFGNSGYVLIP
jgi:hypothetical protein